MRSAAKGSAVKIIVATFVASAVAATAATTAPASRGLLKGIYDDTQLLYGNPDVSYAMLDRLNVDAVRINLHWGGKYGAAKRRPAQPTNPEDPAYDWGLYDRAVNYAAVYGIEVVFSIWGTPTWANRKGLRYAPLRPSDLQAFAYAAARRYSGTWKVKVPKAKPEPPASGEPAPEQPTTTEPKPEEEVEFEERTLPRVRYWLAWNEPNNPAFLRPQYRRVGKRWVASSPRAYAGICNAVYTGIKLTLLRAERVGCGVTAPRGNNQPGSKRAAISPVAFVRAMKAAGARRFDAYAHHPYYGQPRETPTTPPPAARGAAPTAVTLGNINTLVKEVTRLYGAKRIWLTEYGYQTAPDRQFAVSKTKQARYLGQAYAIARRHPRIDMLLWFMLRDDRNVKLGWQSGLLTVSGARKPAYTAFQRVP